MITYYKLGLGPDRQVGIVCKDKLGKKAKEPFTFLYIPKRRSHWILMWQASFFMY